MLVFMIFIVVNILQDSSKIIYLGYPVVGIIQLILKLTASGNHMSFPVNNRHLSCIHIAFIFPCAWQ